MPLSETAIRQAKSESKPIKMFDGRGLYLLLNPNGSRGWRFKYRIDGREKLLSFGVYPDVPLKLARDRCEAARQQLAAGIDPGEKRKAEKVAQGDTFEAIAREWLALQEPKLAPLTFVRPGELRHATWSEFDLDHAEWRIPAERMKMREQHIVPLSRQAVEMLRELQSISRRSSFIFPALGNVCRPMSENTVNAALRRLGYAHDEMTGHGFRSMASTLLNEQGWHPDLIELQLAHAERNQVRAAYNRAQRLVERRKMMQAWADYLDQLKLATGGAANQKMQAA
jgi:integrase